MQDLECFLHVFSMGKDIKSLSLFKMAKEWQNFTRNNSDNGNKWCLANSNSLTQGNPPIKPGIYAIFARKSKAEEIVCFHVGISSNNIRSRVSTRLNKDVSKKYRGVFEWLGKCADIYICSAAIIATKNSKKAKKQLKTKLELLEMIMTVNLKPKSLLLAAGLQ